MPMFPLGSVLFPSVLLPLHVFEPRYRDLVRDCLAGDREFGVVLIERGSEVGGGDIRSMVGTVAHVFDAQELPDGRWAVGAVGSERIRVITWLPDDPYPRAEVEDWPDPDTADHHDDNDRRSRSAVRSEVLSQLRRVLALTSELGDPAAAATVDVAEDPSLASYQIAALSPTGPMDHQSLLAVPGSTQRLDRLAALLAEEESFLHQRLTMGSADDADDELP